MADIIGSANQAEQIDYKLEQIRSKTKAAQEEINLLRSSIGSLSTLLNEDQTVLLDNIFNIVKATNDLQKGKEWIEGIGKVSKVAGQQIGAVTESAISLNKHLQINSDEMQEALGILGQISKDGGASLNVLHEGIPELKDEFKELGVTAKESLASMGAALRTVSLEGMSEAKELQHLEKVLQTISGTDKQQKLKDVFQIDVEQLIQDAKDSGENAADAVLEALSAKFAGNEAVFEQIFGQDTTRFLAPILQDFDTYKKAKEEALAGGQNVDADFARITQNSQSIQQFSQGIGNVGAAFANLFVGTGTMAEGVSNLGSAFMDSSMGVQAASVAIATFSINGVIDSIGSLAGKAKKLIGVIREANFGNLSDKLRPVAGGVSTVLKYAMGFLHVFLKDLFGFGARIVKVLGSGLVKGISTVGRAFSVLGRVLMANPVLLIIGAIATAAYLIYDNWDKIGPWLSDLWAGIKEKVSAAFTFIKNIFFNFTPLGIIIKNWGAITGFVSNLFNTIRTSVSDGWDTIKTTFSNAVSSVIDTVTGLPGKMLTMGGEIMMGLINGITNKVGAAIEAVRAVADKVIGSFKSIFGISSPSKVFKGFGNNMIEGLNIGVDQKMGGATAQMKIIGMAAQHTFDMLGIPNPYTKQGRAATKSSDISSARLPTGYKMPSRRKAGGGFSSGGAQGDVQITQNFNITGNVDIKEELYKAAEMMRREFSTLYKNMMHEQARKAY